MLSKSKMEMLKCTISNYPLSNFEAKGPSTMGLFGSCPGLSTAGQASITASGCPKSDA
jgi:hypothetical protein